jgi:uncharacterized protein YacL
MSESETNQKGNDSQIGDVADDALSIFRVNIFIISVYLSAMALSSQYVKEIGKVFESPFTQFGLILWFGTIGSSILSYRSARLTSTSDIDTSGDVLIQSQRKTIRDIAGAGLGTLGIVIALVIGVFDGVYVENVPAYIGFNIVGVGLFLLMLFRLGFTLIFKSIDLIEFLIRILTQKIIKRLGIESHLESIRVYFLTTIAILIYWRKQSCFPSEKEREMLRVAVEEDITEIERLREEQLQSEEIE